MDPLSTIAGTITMKWWIYGAALAGALTGAFQKKGLNLAGKLVALFVGFTAAVFMGPALVSHIAPGLNADSKEAAFFYYLLGTCANSVIPRFLKWAAEKAGDPLSFLKAPRGEA